MNVSQIFRDKRVLAGVGVAAAAGLFVWFKHRGTSAAAPASDTSQQTAGAGAAAPSAFPDTSSTDAAAYFGQAQSSLQSELTQFQSSVTDLQSALQQIPPVAPPATGGVHTPPVGGLSAHQLHVAHLAHLANAGRVPPKTAIRPIPQPQH